MNAVGVTAINTTLSNAEIISDIIWAADHSGDVRYRLVVVKALGTSIEFNQSIWLMAQELKIE